MPIKVEWKFNENFKGIFLDIWFEKSPESYTQAHEACNELGNEMIIWLSETNSKLYKTIYKQALKETQEEIITQRLYPDEED